MPDVAPAPCSTHPKPWSDTAPHQPSHLDANPSPRGELPWGTPTGVALPGRGTCPPASELPVIPLLPVLPPSCSLTIPFHLSLYPGGEQGAGWGSGPSPQGCPAAAGQKVRPGLAPGTCSGALGKQRRWGHPGGDTGTQHSTLRESNTDGDSLGGHSAVLCRTATLMGT